MLQIQLDVEGLDITVTSESKTATAAGAGRKGKATKTAKAEGTEVLRNAKLRLKAGQRYALVGRNGTGKSSEH